MLLLGRNMGEVGGKRNDDGCRMERNSSMASEGSVDLDQPKVQQASSEVRTRHLM